jgi:hypothetical protein
MAKRNRRELLKAGVTSAVAIGLAKDSIAQEVAEQNQIIATAWVGGLPAQGGVGQFQVSLAVGINSNQGQTNYGTGVMVSSFANFVEQVKDAVISSAKALGFSLQREDILVFGAPARHHKGQ